MAIEQTIEGGVPLVLRVVGAGLDLPADSCDQILADGRVIFGGVSFPAALAGVVWGGFGLVGQSAPPGMGPANGTAKVSRSVRLHELVLPRRQ